MTNNGTGPGSSADMQALFQSSVESARGVTPDAAMLERSLHAVVHDAAPSPDLLAIADEVASDFGMPTASQVAGSSAGQGAGMSGLSKASLLAVGLSSVVLVSSLVLSGEPSSAVDGEDPQDQSQSEEIESEVFIPTGHASDQVLADARQEAEPEKPAEPVEPAEEVTATATESKQRARQPQRAEERSQTRETRETTRRRPRRTSPAASSPVHRRPVQPRLVQQTRGLLAGGEAARSGGSTPGSEVNKRDVTSGGSSRGTKSAGRVAKKTESEAKTLERVVDLDDDLGGELKVIDGARRALNAARPRKALRLLDRYSRRYATGELRGDALLLRLRALCALSRFDKVAELVHEAPSAQSDSLRREMKRLRCSAN